MLVLLGLGVLAAPLSAQEASRITGVVRAAATQRPLAGAQVYVQDLRIGALSSNDGRYLILNVPPGTHRVRVEILGYGTATTTVTLAAGQTAVADFDLTETAVALEEIVVTMTAVEVRARELGNALDAVTSREFENAPVINAEQILGGRIPGVTIMNSSGQPGTGRTVRIRGQNTASQTFEPLLYVDGIRVTNEPIGTGGGSRVSYSPLQDIAAEDIERIEVIKGASATTLYGTEASAGVIQIFTKRGVSGTPIWNAEIALGINDQGHVGPDSDPTELYTRCGDLENLYGLRDRTRGSDKWGERVYLWDPTCPEDGSWFDPGLIQRYNLSVRGGVGDVAYYVSGTYGDTEGTVEGDHGSREGGLRANLDFSPIQDLKFQLNTAYTRRNTRLVEDGNSADGMLLNIGRGLAGNFKGGKGEECDPAPADALCISNGYIFDVENSVTQDRFTTGLTVNYDPTESLTNRFSVGWDYTLMESTQLEPFGYLRNRDGDYSINSHRVTKMSLDYAGSLRNTFFDDLTSTFSWGGQLFRDRHDQTFYFTEDFAGPGSVTLESGAIWDPPDDNQVAETNAGFFLQEVLGWQDRLFLTGGLRVDGNSAFGDDFGLQAYPKVSVSFVLSDYEFWPTEWFDTFKLRGAVGESGRAPGAFDKLRTWSPISGDEGSPGFTPLNIGNADLGPERTREYEAGFDASFFQGRAGLEVTAYRAETTDALVGVTLPPSLGILSTVQRNVGEILSEGLEFQLSGTLFRNDFIDWRARANVALMHTEAVDVAGQVIFADNKAEIRDGHAVATYFGRRVLNANEFADPIVSDTIEAIGPTNPTQLVGLSTNVTLWNRLTLDALVEHQGGHYLPQYTGYQNGRRGAWQPCFDIQAKLIAYDDGDTSALNDVTALERARCYLNGHGAWSGSKGYGHNSDFWVERADFWRLRAVSATLQIPERFVENWASRASVTLSGSNLYLWTDYSGMDPEVEDFSDRSEGGIFDGTGDYGRREYYNLPNPRQWLLSFRVTF
jgi:TonB-linked SusC/RagA family outer membrane protein